MNKNVYARAEMYMLYKENFFPGHEKRIFRESDIPRPMNMHIIPEQATNQIRKAAALTTSDRPLLFQR